jgi:membrane protease YdiL (CAAX protease family)
VTVRAAPAARRTALVPAALPVVAGGLGFLLIRPLIAALPLGRPLLGAGYLALAAAAAGLPAALRRPRPSGEVDLPGASGAAPAATAGPLPWPPVLAAGLVAVAAAALALRPAPASPADAGAVLLGLAAAVAEEALFRQAMYGWLMARMGRWGAGSGQARSWLAAASQPSGPALRASIAVTAAALVFALVHLPFYGMAAFPVDLGAGLLFGWQRWSSGSWTVPAATHAAANLMVVIRLG